MPFAVHTMDHGCPVVAIEDTAEKAAATAESLGYDVGTARVLILPCAVTIDGAVAAVEKPDDAQRKLALAEETAEECQRNERGLFKDLKDAEKRADEADDIVDKLKTHLRMSIKRVEKPGKNTDDETRLSLASSALHDALTIAKGGDLDDLKGALSAGAGV